MINKKKKIFLAVASSLEDATNQSFFRRAGCEVVSGNECSNLLDVLTNDMPDLLIADHNLDPGAMPEVCSRIKGSLRFDKTKVIVVLPKKDNALIDQYRSLGVDEIMHKPLDRSLLLQASADLLDIPLRREVRVPVKMAAKLDLEEGAVNGHTINISSNGFFAYFDKKLDVGNSASFELNLPDEAEPIKGTGQISRVDEESYKPYYGVGVHFVSLGSAARNKIRNFVEAG